MHIYKSTFIRMLIVKCNHIYFHHTYIFLNSDKSLLLRLDAIYFNPVWKHWKLLLHIFRVITKYNLDFIAELMILKPQSLNLQLSQMNQGLTVYFSNNNMSETQLAFSIKKYLPCVWKYLSCVNHYLSITSTV